MTNTPLAKIWAQMYFLSLMTSSPQTAFSVRLGNAHAYFRAKTKGRKIGKKQDGTLSSDLGDTELLC